MTKYLRLLKLPFVAILFFVEWIFADQETRQRIWNIVMKEGKNET